MSKKPLTIKLEVNGDGFERESWYGLGPFTAKQGEDESLTVGIPQHDVQIVPVQSNDYGKYWVLNMGQGKAFATIIDHEKYGKYLRLKLSDDVVLPAEVMEKINYKPKKSGKGAAKSSGGNLWG